MRYPTDIDGNELYAIDNDWANGWGYLMKNGKQIYARKANRDEYYFQNKSGEYPAKKKNGESYYAQTSNYEDIYPEMKNTRQFYLQDSAGNERYAIGENNQFYAKDEDKFEYLARRNKKYYYAQDNSGNEIYPKTASNLNYYRLANETEHCAQNEEGNLYYARDEHGQEFYPSKTIEDKAIREVNNSEI